MKHRIWIETRILVLVSGVEMWKMTPSKSDTVWSIDSRGSSGAGGGQLWPGHPLVIGRAAATAIGVPGEPLGEDRLDQHILVVEQQHLGGGQGDRSSYSGLRLRLLLSSSGGGVAERP